MQSGEPGFFTVVKNAHTELVRGNKYALPLLREKEGRKGMREGES